MATLTWSALENILRQRLMLCVAEWRIPLPERSYIFSAAEEAAADKWSQHIAGHLAGPVPAPPAVQPLLLARLTAAGALAREFAEFAETPFVTQPLAAAVKFFLVEAWHEQMRRRWHAAEDFSWN